MLADDLAETIADGGAAVTVAIDRLLRKFFDSGAESDCRSKEPISSTEQMPIP